MTEEYQKNLPQMQESSITFQAQWDIIKQNKTMTLVNATFLFKFDIQLKIQATNQYLTLITTARN